MYPINYRVWKGDIPGAWISLGFLNWTINSIVRLPFLQLVLWSILTMFRDYLRWLVVEPTHLKNMLVKLKIFPKLGVKMNNNKNWNHHLVRILLPKKKKNSKLIHWIWVFPAFLLSLTFHITCHAIFPRFRGFEHGGFVHGYREPHLNLKGHGLALFMTNILHEFLASQPKKQHTVDGNQKSPRFLKTWDGAKTL